jgi:hypothetical protein
MHGLEVGEGLVVSEQVPAQGLVEPFHLAGGRGRGGSGEAMHDAVVPADPIEEHLTTPPEPGGELFAIVSQDLVGDPVTLQGLGERQAHGPARGPQARRGDHTEPGVVIDPGHDLDLGAVDQEHAPHDVELPQRHRGVAFPARVVLPPAAPPLGVDQAATDQDPIHRRHRRHWHHPRASELIGQAARTPPGMLPAQLTHRGLHLGRRLVRTELGAVRPIHQPAQALVPIAAQPRVHGLARDPDLGGHPCHRLASEHSQHRPIALLNNGQLHQHRSRRQLHAARKRRKASRPITATVNHQVKPDRQASTGAGKLTGMQLCRIRLYRSRAPAQPAPGGRCFRRPTPPAGGDGRPVVYGIPPREHQANQVGAV